ncbi:hypothetical protein [Pseudoalteromonas sp. JC3]|uniref:hypothetical protein n=1 Tax=Pseudoalteromonas sp. JC3 TaxID=2810196 RepID=UPI0019D220A0|nr:hypothetical protein [Pseudoalteromonas sp. JC3]MBR8841678.1 hypothetical protein [Pseudoalteromonas sp. JC3]WJE07703.1 hypothetical protein QSH61_12460 [Pseudoalteromonas sp. JC3]
MIENYTKTLYTHLMNEAEKFKHQFIKHNDVVMMLEKNAKKHNIKGKNKGE